MKPHLNKCFANINSLEISDKQLEITHLISFEGERLDIPKTIRIRGPAEQWLGKSIREVKCYSIIYIANYSLLIRLTRKWNVRLDKKTLKSIGK